MKQPHFYDPATSTIEQARIKGYGVAGWYVYATDTESEVIGPFERLEEAEAALRERVPSGGEEG